MNYSPQLSPASDEPLRFLTALPVYNECKHVTEVIGEVAKYAADILVVDDGSTDCTREYLAGRDDLNVIVHPENRGYGAALQTAFEYAIDNRYDVIVTIDCDGQHEPQLISQLAEMCQHADIVSGSRYLKLATPVDNVPQDRRQINQQITEQLNAQLGLRITDAFCGLKAYRTTALAKLELQEPGYAMPLELWVQAAKHKLCVKEMAVPLIYLDEERSFGGSLDAAETRLRYYQQVIAAAMKRAGLERTRRLTPFSVRPGFQVCFMTLEGRYRRYRAPQGNGEILCDPSWSSLPNLLQENRAQLAAHELQIGDRQFTQLRTDARESLLLEAARHTAKYSDPPSPPAADTPLVLTGHQPGLHHPGVWLKNFAAARLAEQTGGVAVNLIIDSDLCRTTAVSLPIGTVDQPRLVNVAYDQVQQAQPFEERAIIDAETWRSFGARACAALAPLVPHPLLESWWENNARPDGTENLGTVLARARHRLEQSWGIATLEVPLSAVCQTEPFRQFMAHILLRCETFREAYNLALAGYRRAHRLRSAAQPIPDLAMEDQWCETPFWMWSSEKPVRRALYLRSTAAGIEISDLQGWSASLAEPAAGSAESLVAWILALEQQGVKLRSRALVTTMFARLLLGDLFIHGIGGAKYDQVTDEIVERFFGIVPPPHTTITGTLHLPIAHPSSDMKRERELFHTLREFKYHPEAIVDRENLKDEHKETFRDLAAHKTKWVETEKTHANCAERHQAIVELNTALARLGSSQRDRWQQQLQQLRNVNQANRVLESREYPACLFPQEAINNFLLDFPVPMP